MVLSLAGYGLTFMLIAGLVVGLVFAVADAVGDTMHLSRRLRERRIARRDTGQEISASRTILDAALEVRGPMAFATLIILVAAAPLLLLPELTGLFFRPLAGVRRSGAGLVAGVADLHARDGRGAAA